MKKNVIFVNAEFDPEAEVWFVESSNVPGLNAEASSIELLVSRLPDVIADLAELSDVLEGFASEGGEYRIEVVAHAATKLNLSAAA